MNRRVRTPAGYLYPAILISLAAFRADAAAFFVSPIRVELTVDRPTAAMSVQNDSDEILVIQAQPIAWSQSGGQDIYDQTRDLIVTPAIFSVAPRSNQVVRVGLRRPVTSASEISYRLSLQEIAQPQVKTTGVQMLLNIVLPVFVQPASAVAAHLTWEALRSADNTLTVRTRNDGNAHIQIYSYQLLDTVSELPLATQSTPAYVLPGQDRQWQLKPDAQLTGPDRKLHLVAQTDAGEIDAEIALDMP